MRPSERHAREALSPDGTWLAALLLDERAGGWRVDVPSGAAQRTPYPRRSSWQVDTDGVVVEHTLPRRPPALIDWAGGQARRIDLTQVGLPVGLPIRIVVGPNLVSGTVYGEGEFAVFALDRKEPHLVDTLPTEDYEGNDSNWGLRPLHALRDGSVLLWVAVPGPARADGWRLVRWRPATDRLEVVTASDANPIWSVTFAGEHLEGEPPSRGRR